VANSVYMGMSAALAAQRRLEVASNNVANVNTAGFRQQHVVFQDFLVQTLDGTPSQKGFTALTETVVDRSAGPMEQTGNPLDVAIRDDGYFVVEGPGGPLLSRAGSFQVTTDGQLVDASGYSVLSGNPDDGFSPVQTRPDAGPVRVTADGTVEQGGTPLAVLAVVTVDDSKVTPAGGAHLQAPVEAMTATRADLAPGYLEGSNVNVVRGMVDLIEINRDYQTASKLMSESRKLDEAVIKR